MPKSSTSHISQAMPTSMAEAQGVRVANQQKKCKAVQVRLSQSDLVLPKSRSAPSSRELLGQDRWHAIHQQQQRLLLLHHAAHCKQEIGRCTATPHCDTMRKLWDHIKECNAPTCTDRYCTSSRHIWIHYGKCKHVNCQVCMPVRVEICRDT
mmetsp:Transcript_28085/g.50855  ORF Transcript_28085/g.50855 Transcript_28085/m.50855 type:complete len:152 (-) Transcript_28085:689-1144(-)